jgi:hypothetical protein
MTIKLWSLEEIEKLKGLNNYIVSDGKYIVLVDVDHRLKRVWEKQENETIQEIDAKEMVQRIAAYLSRHVSLEKLLKDKLLHEPITTILDLNKRVLNEGQVKEHKGCYYLSIKGKQGKPLEIDL